MPSGSLAAYLAKNYLTASNGASQPDRSDFQDSTRPKKKRKKNKDLSGQAAGLVIADDDEDLSLQGQSRKAAESDDDDNVPTFEAGAKSAEFRKKRGGSSGWKVVSVPAPESESADRILAEAAEESRLRRRGLDDDDAPAVVEETGNGDDGPRMQSGARAGLQTAADTAALVAREEEQEQRQRGKKSKRNTEHEAEQETIYRDASGRRIDVSLKRAEARAAEAEKRRAERQAKEDAMGEVQRREKEERKRDLEDARFLTLGRTADDEDMNEMLRARDRWDDPMAAYMANKKLEEEAPTRASKAGGGGGGAAATSARKKTYSGPPAAPNRYGILPGWRWDGVDRSNGFEKDWFQARSKKGREEELRYQWQMDE